jgi:hypothetical protein
VIVPSSSRLIWRTRLPRRATLRVHVALPASPASTVRFRMGVSDHRVYDKLVERIVSSGSQQGWVPLEADLRRYAGLQLSIFYRPEGREWRLVLSTDHLEGSPAVAFWAEPRVETDTEAAGRFFRAHTKGPARGDS